MHLDYASVEINSIHGSYTPGVLAAEMRRKADGVAFQMSSGDEAGCESSFALRQNNE